MSQTVRVRFAPSPTGYLHVGSLRTALYNYLFARHHHGKMVLRIEDTDRTRYVENATESLIRTLKIMEIEYDEGPDNGGPDGPYMQSERLEIYNQHIQKLLETGEVYYCFCSPERLEEMRKQQEAAGLTPKYDGTCRSLSEDEISKNLAENKPHVIRLKMPQSGETRFYDVIRGEVSFQNELIDDQVLVKSDGFPTYHLANVIDDHLMEITHVIRGEEWLSSIPKHLKLYQALGWESPQMVHLPLLLNPDRSKLSKRQGDVAVEDYLAKGYLPEALINFIALLGWNPGTEQEIFTLQQLVEQFSLERVNKSGAVFDVRKLDWMNGHYLREMPEDERLQFLTPFLEKAGYDVSDPEKNRKVVEAVYKRISTGQEIEKHAAIFYTSTITLEDEEAKAVLAQPTAVIVLKSFLDKVERETSVDVEIFSRLMKEVQKETGIKKQELWMPVRVALSGVTHGPELPLVIDILGKEKIVGFVQQVLDHHVPHSH